MRSHLASEFHFDRAMIERALLVRETFVRSDVQINIDNPRAKGRRLVAAEVAFSFGSRALEKLLDRGAFVVQTRSNASSHTIVERLQQLGLSSAILADRLDFSTDQLTSYLNGKIYFPIRKLELACAMLGLEDTRISAHNIEETEPAVRLRYYDAEKGDVHLFDSELVLQIAARVWKVMKIEFLQAFIDVATSRNEHADAQASFIDSEYSVKGSLKPTVEKGKQLAERVRLRLHLTPQNRRVVSVSDALHQVGSLTYSDEMPESFCGMTLISSWSGRRIVVANIVGENSRSAVRRFTLAHELAHAASDPDSSFVPVQVGASAGQTGGRRADNAKAARQRDLPELRANSFAANFLAPDDDIRNALSENLSKDPIRVVADEFGISFSAAKWRLISLGLADKSSPVPPNEDLPNSSQRPHGVDPLDDPVSLDDQLREISQRARDLHLIHQDTLESIHSILDDLRRSPRMAYLF